MSERLPSDDDLTIETPQTPPDPGAPEATRPPLPTRAGRYPILRELGRGGMGVVYLAQDPTLGRTVALKRLPERLARDPERLARFQREARLLAAVNHPNIATIHSLEESDGSMFLTMEAIEGETLADRLRRGPLALAESLAIARGIARALETAHARGIVHRDLKPGNVMLSPEAGVKVLDFGLAAAAGETLGGDAPGSGTPGYMSPEQVNGATPDPRSDVWAFGCTLYECLVGARLVQGDTPIERLHHTLTAAPDLERLPQETPPRLRETLAHCLEREAEARPESLTAPRQVIEELLARLSLRVDETSDRSRAGTTPTNLPARTSTFVGRDEEVREVTQRLGEHRLVSLTGIGGVGKTRLALRVAEELLSHTANDGVWLVELAALRTGEDVPGAIAKAIGAASSPGQSIADAVIERLADTRTLLILDTCEHVVDAAAGIAAALLARAPRTRILATSRERLGVESEVTFAVPVLTVPAGDDLGAIGSSTAVELFLQRARQVGAPITLDAGSAVPIAEICRRLDGIPLAIELAASRLKVLSIEELLARLDDRFRVLTGGARGMLPHHRTLRALIDWSYEQLDPAEQRLLCRASVFAGGWTLEAAEAVAVGGDVHDWEVLDLLSRLVDKSLVVVDTSAGSGLTRFRMLDTVRAYAADRLEECRETASMRTQHRACFIDLARRAEPHLLGAEQAQWFTRLDAEHENLRSAIESALAPDVEPGVALSFVAALFRFWMIRSYWQEADRVSRAALQRDAGRPPSVDRAKVLNGVAAAAYYRSDYDEATRYWELTRDAWRALGKSDGVGAATMNLGNVAYARGDYDAAESYFRGGLDAGRSAGNQDIISRSLISLGNVGLARGHYEETRRYCTEAVERLETEGNDELVAHALLGLGASELRLGAHDAARAHFERSLALQETLGDRRNRAIAIINLGSLAGTEKRFPEAWRRFREALRLFHELSDVPSVASALEGLASIAAQQKAPMDALFAYALADNIREATGTPRIPDEEKIVGMFQGAARAEVGEEEAARVEEEARLLDVDAAVEWALATFPS